mmetsp:Transcript_9604/g.8265  ORF Transcript_9604/g.8265 Transcript_9604/m.8265 type:complete len:131 (-) Transcript_9604:1100-1492(-)
MSSDTRDKFMEEAKRDNHNAKINCLVRESDHLFDIMEHLTYLKTNWSIFTQKRFNNIRDLSTLISLLINLGIMQALTYEVSDSTTVKDEGEVFGFMDYQTFVNALGIIQIATSSLMILFWTALNGPIILK